MADQNSRSRSPRPARDKLPRERSRSPKRRDTNDAARNEDRQDGTPRRRSRSPRRRDDNDRDRNRDRRDRPRGNGGGRFKWKEKNSRDDRDGGERRLQRGYRNRSRSPRRDGPSGSKGASVEDKFGVTDKFGTADKFGSAKKTTEKDTNEKKDTDGKEPPKRPAAPASAMMTVPSIIVHVNDRLGTKASIVCSPSDTIKNFKVFVAMQIARQPHEILLKRQGERPFKDQLTLEDYGVSNGVQIDLEIDTGE